MADTDFVTEPILEAPVASDPEDQPIPDSFAEPTTEVAGGETEGGETDEDA
jgi:hypothetical protein